MKTRAVIVTFLSVLLALPTVALPYPWSILAFIVMFIFWLIVLSVVTCVISTPRQAVKR